MSVGSPYFVLLTIGFAAGMVWFQRRARGLGLDPTDLIDLCIAALICGVVGSRLLHVAVEPLPGYALAPHEVAHTREALAELDAEGRAAVEAALAAPPVAAPWAFIARMPAGAQRDAAVAAVRRDPAAVPAHLWYRARPAEVLQFWKGGLAYVGGLVLAVVGCVALARRRGLPVRELADLAGPAVVLGLVFGRIGCFLGGCCYGAVCEPAWWAAQPGWYDAVVGGAHRYPTALLSAANAAALFLALRALLARRAFPGEVALAMLALYMPGRFAIEALRADPRGGAAGLSTSQLAVLATGLPAAAVWGVARWMRRGGDAAAPPEPAP